MRHYRRLEHDYHYADTLHCHAPPARTAGVRPESLPGRAVLGRQHDDAALRWCSFAARPLASLRDCRSNEDGKLALPQPRIAANQRGFSDGDASWPKPLDWLWLNSISVIDH